MKRMTGGITSSRSATCIPSAGTPLRKPEVRLPRARHSRCADRARWRVEVTCAADVRGQAGSGIGEQLEAERLFDVFQFAPFAGFGQGKGVPGGVITSRTADTMDVGV